MKRCKWAGTEERMVKYHDKVWGVPKHDEKELFEALLLDSSQAGLSWSTILNKRENYKKAFANFDPEKVAKFTKRDEQKLMKNKGIVRNKLKISASINNAKRFLEVQKEFGSFDKYIWSFTKGKVIKNKFKTMKGMPSNTPLSDKITKDLKKRGFKFVGTTIIYAFMQGIGMVNDHTLDCFRYKEV